MGLNKLAKANFKNKRTRHNNSREIIEVLPTLIPVCLVDVLQSLLLIDRNESTAAERAFARESSAGLLVLLETSADHWCLAMHTVHTGAVNDAGGEAAVVRQKRLFETERA